MGNTIIGQPTINKHLDDFLNKDEYGELYENID